MVDDLDIQLAEQILMDNGIKPEEVKVVLQEIGYLLINKELYPRKEENRVS